MSWFKRFALSLTYTYCHLLIFYTCLPYELRILYLPAAHAAHALEEGGNLVRELADVGQLVPLARLARPAWSGAARSSKLRPGTPCRAREL